MRAKMIGGKDMKNLHSNIFKLIHMVIIQILQQC